MFGLRRRGRIAYEPIPWRPQGDPKIEEKKRLIFDQSKLDWINNHHLASLSFAEFSKRLTPYIETLGIDLSKNKNSIKIIEAMRSSKPTLLGVAESLRPFFFQIESYDQEACKKFLIGSESVLEFVLRKLNTLDTLDEKSINKVLEEAQISLSLSTSKLNQPIRIAMTGSTQSPSLGLTLSLFDIAEINNRINAALEYLTKLN